GAALWVRGGAGSGSVAPYAVVPTSLGWSRSKKYTRGTTERAVAETVSAAVRQPCAAVSDASTGRKASWPVAPPAVSTPVTTPRWATNHRPVTVATNDMAIEPVPSPTRTPQHRTSCQLAFMNTVSPLPAATSSNAEETTLRIPQRSISAAANGAVSPKRIRLTETASEMIPVDQPNSWWSGLIITPGVARKPAAPTVATNATPATIQARCKRLLVCVIVTGSSSGTDHGPDEWPERQHV